MKLIFCRKTFSKKPILKIVSMGNTGKLLKKNKTQKQQKTFYNKSCSEKTVSKIVSMGYKCEQLKKTQETIYSHKKSFPQKTISKIVPLIVHRKINKKQN